MKIAVLGSKGMLGYAVSEYFKKDGHSVLTLSRNEFDIATDPISKLETKLVEFGVEAVVNCAGVIKPRIADLKIEEVLKVNSIFPHNLAKLCNKMGISCFHVTTDCVYSGNDGKYTEDSYFDADDVYGMTKNAGEPASECMVLRTSIIGEEKGQSRSLLEWARSQKGKPVNGFVNHNWNGVTTTYLAEIVNDIIKSDRYEKGLFHVHSPEPVNKFELVSTINEVYDLDMKISKTEGPTFCDRSLSSCKSLTSTIATKPISQQIQEMKHFFEGL